MIIDNPEEISMYQVKPNFNLGKRSVASSQPSFYDYVIITADSLVDAFDAFLEWKTRKGYVVGVVTIEDCNTSYLPGHI